MAKLEVKHWEHFIDYTFGKDTAYCPIKCSKRYAMGEFFEVSPDDPIFKTLYEWSKEPKLPENATTMVYVLLDESREVICAFRQDCTITQIDVRREIYGARIYFYAKDIDNRLKGTFDFSTMVFQANDDSLYNINWWCADIYFGELIEMFSRREMKEIREGYWMDVHKQIGFNESRFLESVLYGLPMQSITIATDDINKKKVIVDGYKRIQTGCCYIKQRIMPISCSEYICYRWRGKYFQELSIEEQNRIKNTTFRVNVVNFDELEDNDYRLFSLYERINGRKIEG